MSLKRSIMGTLGVQLSGIILGLGTSILSTRLLGPEGKGHYAIFIVGIGFGTLFFDFGIQTTLKYLVAKKELAMGKAYTILSLLFPVILTLFGIGVLLSTIYNTELFLPNTYQAPFHIILLLSAFSLTIIFRWSQSLLAASLNFKYVNISTFIKGVFLLAAFTFVYNVTESGLNPVVAWIIFTSSIAIAFLTSFGFHVKVNGPIRFVKPERKDLDAVMKWGGLQYFSNLAQYLNYRLDFWFVNFYLGSASLGIYSLSSNLGQMLWLIPTAFSAVFLPNIAKALEEGNNDFLERTLLVGRWLLVIGLLATLIFLLIGRYIITFLYGGDFERSFVPLALLLIGIVPFGLTKLYAAFLAGNGKQKKNLIASVIGLIFTIVLDIILIPSYGLPGAAVATSLSYLLTTTYVCFVMRKYFHVSLSKLFIPKISDLQAITTHLGNLRKI